MKKKSQIALAILSLGALIAFFWPTSAQKNPGHSPMLSIATPSPLPEPLPRRALARKAVKPRPVDANQVSLAASAATVPAKKTETRKIPLPTLWSGDLVKQEVRSIQDSCELDRPCSPRGRDGVLLVGASIAWEGWVPKLPQILDIGSYRQRTPLLVYR